MLAVVRLGLVGVALAVDDVVPPDVAALDPVDLGLGAAHDEHLLDRVVVLERLVDGGLERGGLAAPELPVGGDDHLALGVVDAGVQGLGREAAEDHRVGGAEPGAGEHGEHRLGDHRHVDGHGVAGAHAELGERVGRLGHLALEVGVGDGAGVAGLALEVDGDPVAVAGLDVAVDAVVGDVELAADEPLRERRVVPVEGALEVLRPRDAACGPARPRTPRGRRPRRRTSSAVPLACAVNAGSGAKSISCTWLDRLSSVTACSSSLSVRCPANPLAGRTATACAPDAGGRAPGATSGLAGRDRCAARAAWQALASARRRPCIDGVQAGWTKCSALSRAAVAKLCALCPSRRAIGSIAPRFRGIVGRQAHEATTLTRR